jgi:hypothetical protein
VGKTLFVGIFRLLPRTLAGVLRKQCAGAITRTTVACGDWSLLSCQPLSKSRESEKKPAQGSGNSLQFVDSRATIPAVTTCIFGCRASVTLTAA